MKKQELVDVKQLEVKEILGKVGSLRKELVDLVLDKNMKKLKDVKVVSKKRRDVATLLTIARQKQLLQELEAKVEKKKGEKASTKTEVASN